MTAAQTTSSSSSDRDAATRPLEIALAGNPNVGKTTLFNRLTGARQRVGNYPGVTVEKKIGRMKLGDQMIIAIDLPGAYSLAASSADERVVIDVLAGHIPGTRQPDVVLCVVDATNLMRNLFLASQIADIGIPMVIALNMTDAARRRGVEVDPQLLSERLGVPVVPTVATRGEGLAELRKAITRVISSGEGIAPMPWPQSVENALQVIAEGIERDLGITVEREPLQDQQATSVGGASAPTPDVPRIELLRMLFDVDSAVPDRIGWRPEQALPVIQEARKVLSESGLNPISAEAILRYGRLGELLDGVFHPETRQDRPRPASESIDRLLTHRVWGLIIFVALMTIVFESIYAFAVPVMDGVEMLFGWLSGITGELLATTPMLQSLVVDGVIAGIGSVLIFLPQILILFLFIALLEDSGYMARAAFLMDKLFSWCGLNGKSFVPMLSSYACAVPGIMATRTIDDPKARLVTILISPLMSCSARLPVYVLLIGAFIEPHFGPLLAGIFLVGMHFVGLAVAIPVALLINRFVVRGKRVPFVMEMPPYRTPQMRSVLWRMWQSGEKFLKRAGTIIFAMTVVIWALSYFPRGDEVETTTTDGFVASIAEQQGVSQERVRDLITLDESRSDDSYDEALAVRLENRIQGAYVEQSYLGRIGKTLQPLFAPAGFDWKITVGIVASFPAREVIVATLGIIYNLGGDVDEESDDLIGALQRAEWQEGPRMGQPVFTPLVAVGVMVFFALCLQCGSTVAVIARESNWWWALFAFLYMTVLAWLGAVVVYQAGGLFLG